MTAAPLPICAKSGPGQAPVMANQSEEQSAVDLTFVEGLRMNFHRFTIDGLQNGSA